MERDEIRVERLLQLEEEEEELEDKFDISVSVKDPEKIGGNTGNTEEVQLWLRSFTNDLLLL